MAPDARYDGGVTGTEHTFVFADLAGYTALTEAHGDDDAAVVATRFHELAVQDLPPGARLVKTIGDAVMIAAATVEDGITIAIRIMDAVRRRTQFPAVRIGLHTGAAASRDGDFFGAAVNLAARVAAVARAGEIVCTEPIAAVAVARQIVPARPMGTVRLKNVSAPVTLYELATGEAITALHHIDPVCRMQVAAATAAVTTQHDGVAFHFCSESCAARFSQVPDQFVVTAIEH